MLRLIVTGQGNSGTKYTSELLTACGVPCGHERVFGLTHRPDLALVAESSWLVMPYLPVAGTTVVHQVRDPIAWLRSKLRMGGNAITYQGYIAQHGFPEYPNELKVDPVRALMKMWVAWNERIEPHAMMRYRLEDIDVNLTLKLAEIAGVKVRREQVNQSLMRVSRNTNAHGSRHVDTVTWANLPVGEEREAFAWMAKRYGYSI